MKNTSTTRNKLSRKSLGDSAARWWARLRGNPHARPQPDADAPPLRAELFGADQMEQHGKTLAGLDRLSSQRGRDQLLARLAENADVLLQAYKLLTAAGKAKRRISPAA